MQRSLLLPALLLSGCLSPASTGSQRSAIVGGTRDTGDPGVVLLVGQRPGSQSVSLCTAEVISPHVVLTAAHCVSPQVVGAGAQFQVFLGDDVNDQNQFRRSNFVDVASTTYDTAFSVNNLEGGHDIAVAITADALPVTPLAVNTDAITNADIGANLRLVGFGVTGMSSTSQDSSGVKRQVTTKLGQYNDLLLAFGDAQHNTCEGDSGGPAFMTRNGKEVIIGVTSFGDQDCQQGGADTRVDAFWDSFIAPKILEVDGKLPDGTPAVTPSTDGGTDNPPTDPAAADGGTTPSNGMSSLAVGESCTDSSQCTSGTCTLGNHRFCTQSCKPSDPNSCPSGMQCGDVHGANYCLLPEGGCSATPRGTAGGTTSGLLGALFLLGFAAFLRRYAR